MSIMSLHFLRYMNKMTKMFMTIFVLMLFSQPWTKANDISEFEIEGMSIGDSLLKYFSESYLNNAKRYDSSNTPWKNDEMLQLRTGKKGPYTEILFSLKKNDKDFYIYGINGIIKMENINDCNEKQKKIVSDISALFPKIKSKSKNIKHRGDPSGKSTISEIYFILNKNKIIPDKIAVACYDWSEKMQYYDNLRVIISSSEFRNWIINEAYN